MALIDEAVAAIVAERASRIDLTAQPKVKGRSKAFYSTFAWRKLRYQVLLERGGRCEACGRTAKDGVILNIDHIEPLSKNWERRLDKANLQVLCKDCNHGS
jgi:5-methylcytosine-specific restriction endonuclease McrA